MKLCSLLFLVAVSSGHYIHRNVIYPLQSNYLCQQWCYRYDHCGAVFLTCCHMKVRHGSCPKGCLFGYGAKIHQLLCKTDGNCPIGYKCCPDSCSYFQKICKPIAYEKICRTPPIPFSTTRNPHTYPTTPPIPATTPKITTLNPHTYPTSRTTKFDITTHNPHTATTRAVEETPTTQVLEETTEDEVTQKLPTPVYQSSGEINIDEEVMKTTVRDEESREITSNKEEETTTISNGNGSGGEGRNVTGGDDDGDDDGDDGDYEEGDDYGDDHDNYGDGDDDYDPEVEIESEITP